MSESEPLKRFYDVEVAGAIGKIILSSVPMSYAECKYFWEQGIKVPLELWPKEVWWEGDIPRFGEEAMGEDF